MKWYKLLNEVDRSPAVGADTPATLLWLPLPQAGAVPAEIHVTTGHQYHLWREVKAHTAGYCIVIAVFILYLRLRHSQG